MMEHSITVVLSVDLLLMFSRGHAVAVSIKTSTYWWLSHSATRGLARNVNFYFPTTASVLAAYLLIFACERPVTASRRGCAGQAWLQSCDSGISPSEPAITPVKELDSSICAIWTDEVQYAVQARAVLNIRYREGRWRKTKPSEARPPEPCTAC